MAHAESRKTLTVTELYEGVLSGNRAVLARAITLIESSKAAHRARAQELLQRLLPHAGKAHRIGITGVPGVGKSTLIDRLGVNLIDRGHRVAVLAVDPTSSRTGGSILGDKTRMPRLAQDPNAFVRPSPSSGTLGGVAAATRESISLVEAAGFDIVLVETVGVGQAETAVAGMVDVFLLLALPGAGDDLQGLKKGVVELADTIAVTKADGDNIERAKQAASDYRTALQILNKGDSDRSPPVLCVSAMANRGLDRLWDRIEEHRATRIRSGAFEERRRAQAVKWMHDMLHTRLIATLKSNRKVARRLSVLESQVSAGLTTPSHAVDEIAGLLRLDAE